MPAVVPQLKTITLGGAVAGVGIEASSHRHGLVHDTVLEIEVLLGDGRIVTCTPDNEFADLFFGFPNSYGTLGYALRVKAKAVPVRPYVRLEHLPFTDAERFFAALGERLRAGEADFIDGTVFSPQRALPHARALRGRGALHERLHLRADLLPLDRASGARTTSPCAISSGAGTPTGSGARRTCWRRIPWCGGSSTAGSAWARAPTRRSCAGTAASARRRSSSACSACTPSR